MVPPVLIPATALAEDLLRRHLQYYWPLPIQVVLLYHILGNQYAVVMELKGWVIAVEFKVVEDLAFIHKLRSQIIFFTLYGPNFAAVLKVNNWALTLTQLVHTFEILGEKNV